MIKTNELNHEGWIKRRPHLGSLYIPSVPLFNRQMDQQGYDTKVPVWNISAFLSVLTNDQKRNTEGLNQHGVCSDPPLKPALHAMKTGTNIL